MFEYLSKIDNWELYKAIERGLILYEFNSDNVIEIIFSWLKECRAHASAYYVTYAIIYENMNYISELHKWTTNINGMNKLVRMLGLTER